jgi:hypothetical protein
MQGMNNCSYKEFRVRELSSFEESKSAHWIKGGSLKFNL